MEKKQRIVAIRREDKSAWERRTPLPPHDMSAVIKADPNIKFLVQPSSKRIFKDKEYEKEGATITEDISSADVILGVKEVPIGQLAPNKVMVFFAHVIKAQESGMPLLDAILEKKVTLIDYEPIKDETGKRLVAFGKFAGNAGAIDMLSGLGKLLLANGFSTPFLQVGMSYTYFNLQEAKESLKKIAERIRTEEIPEAYRPLIFAVTGQGRCADGALEILNCLNVKLVSPNDLEGLVKNKDDPAHASTIYLTTLNSEHFVTPEDASKKFDKNEYYDKPNSFKPIFHEKYLPYISVIFHCIYWDPRFPRMITSQQMKDLVVAKRSRLLAVSDITCDFEGSIEFLKRVTTIDKPFYIWNATDMKIVDEIGDYPNGILYLSIDHLPTELPWDASVHFGASLRRFIPTIAYLDPTRSAEDQNLPMEIHKAIVTMNGEYGPEHKYLKNLREAQEKMRKQKGYNEKGVKPIKRVQSFASIKIRGHLFDTFSVNKIVDALSSMNIQYSFIDWHVGRSNAETSQVVVQIFSSDMDVFHQVMEIIEDIAEKNKLEISIDQ